MAKDKLTLDLFATLTEEEPRLMTTEEAASAEPEPRPLRHERGRAWRHDPALMGSVMWYGAAFMPRLRQLAEEKLPKSFVPLHQSPLRTNKDPHSTTFHSLWELDKEGNPKAQTRLDYLLMEANALSEINPLQLPPDGKSGAQGAYTLPAWSEVGISGPRVIAILVFGLFVKMGEQPELCMGLVDAWPLAEALFLVDGPNNAIARMDAKHRAEDKARAGIDAMFEDAPEVEA